MWSVTATDLMDGMKWAAGLTYTGRDGSTVVNVINVSVGVPGQACTTAYQNEITALTISGIVIVAAAGDNNPIQIQLIFLPIVIMSSQWQPQTSMGTGQVLAITVQRWRSAPPGGNVMCFPPRTRRSKSGYKWRQLHKQNGHRRGCGACQRCGFIDAFTEFWHDPQSDIGSSFKKQQRLFQRVAVRRVPLRLAAAALWMPEGFNPDLVITNVFLTISATCHGQPPLQ